MRIVAGEFRGRALEAPSEKTTRPTTDRVRESMFSSIYSRRADLSSTRVLDAFAGSGALGLEALSRGAESCVFFERDAAARSVLEANISSLGLSAPRAVVRGTDVGVAVQTGLCGRGGAFGLVLLDPPYAVEAPRVASFLSALAANGDLAPKCIVVYEHALRGKADLKTVEATFEDLRELEVTGHKKYGKIGVMYLKHVPADAD